MVDLELSGLVVGDPVAAVDSSLLADRDAAHVLGVAGDADLGGGHGENRTRCASRIRQRAVHVAKNCCQKERKHRHFPMRR